MRPVPLMGCPPAAIDIGDVVKVLLADANPDRAASVADRLAESGAPDHGGARTIEVKRQGDRILLRIAGR